IDALEADILFVCEGPQGETRAKKFFALVAPQYDLITRGGDHNDYGMRNGTTASGAQWLWFLVRRGAGIDAQLLHLDKWRELTVPAYGEDIKPRSFRWNLALPRWKSGEKLHFSTDESHIHHRAPQVLQLTIGEAFFEIIGCHLKSKHTSARPIGDVSDDKFFAKNPELVAELVSDRIKLTTECTDIRHYINARFDADETAPIIICGDLNDGPGKERIERRFLYHDLVSVLQGDIFFARRFLNHALFDLPEGERWSYFLDRGDALDPGRNPRILLDHIMFSQSMTGADTGDKFTYRAMGGAGLVEHEIHHRVTSARFNYANTSDHLPVSMTFTRREDQNPEDP
ncbi:MAG: endonuclease/exonuclease/phosphatase, partial [Pseudomonadota bacterium]